MNTSYTSRQLVKFTELLEQQGVTPEVFQKMLSDGRLVEIFKYGKCEVDRKKLHKAFGPFPNPIDEFEIEVDYSRPLGKMMNDVRWCRVSENFDLDQFALNGTGVQKKVIKPLYFGLNRHLGIADVESWYQPGQTSAGPEDLIAFIAKYGSEVLRHKDCQVVGPRTVHKVNGRPEIKKVASVHWCHHGGYDLLSEDIDNIELGWFKEGTWFLTVCEARK